MNALRLGTVAVIGLFSAILDAKDAIAQQSVAQYPTKPIRVILPLGTGGGTDLLARALAQRLTETLKQSVIIENRPGAGGTIGHELAVRATPDGYTIAMVSASYGTNPALFELPYDPIHDITPISLLATTGWMLSVHPSVPAKSTQELIALAKAKPGVLNYGSTGTGGSTHLVTELFNLMAGTKMTHVPYKSTGTANTDVVGGHLHLIFGGMAQMVAMYKSGRLRAIAVTTAKRINAVPDIPTIGETIPGYEATAWYGSFGPKGIPGEIITRLNTEIDKALADPAMRERLAGEGLEPIGGPPQQFLDVVIRDVPKWIKVVKQAGIKRIQ